MSKLLEYSEKNILESRMNFERGVETIKRIRKNLDEIHHALRDIQKSTNVTVRIQE